MQGLMCPLYVTFFDDWEYLLQDIQVHLQYCSSDHNNMSPATAVLRCSYHTHSLRKLSSVYLRHMTETG
jgi:hypothetical protein